MTDPEHQLVLACVRMCAGSGSLNQVTTSLEGITKWDVVLGQASRHAVTLQVAHVLGQVDPSHVPAGVLMQLRRAARDGALRNLQLTATLIALLDRLESHRIQAVPFKGPVLASLLYGEAALRESVDLDILIRRKDVEAAANLLVAMGYDTSLPGSPAARAAYLRVRHEVPFTKAGGVLIELHQVFLAPPYSFPLDYDSLWERLEPGSIGPRRGLTLRPDDLLLSLCAHATTHSWSRLAWIADIAALLRAAADELSGSDIMARASSIGAGRMVRLGLILAGDLLDAPVPREMWREAKQDTTAVRLAESVTTTLFDEAVGAGELRRHLFFLRARERLRDRAHYCGHLAFIPTELDHAVISLPGLLSPLYYPLHTARVGMKYARACVRAAVGANRTDPP